MKFLTFILFAGLFLSACSASKSGTAAVQPVNTTFKVRGLCGMCKDRIEATALSTKGVKTAKWDDEAQMLSIQYFPDKVTAETVQQKIASVGHDTDKFKAPDAVYAKLPACCQYERE